MGRSLVIVESPAKARTIKKYVGDDFDVLASVGHVKNLPDHDLGVDVEDGFRAQYEVIRGKRDVLRKIRASSRNAEKVYLAPDPDREGEAIAWHIAEELGEREGVYRVRINEITPKAVLEALESPGSLDLDRYNAQQTRRILDRLVGYQISPLLWKKVRQGLSAGRVQSVALKMIAKREAEVVAFKPTEYWRILADVEGEKPPPFRVRFVRTDGKKRDVPNGEDAASIVAEIEAAEAKVATAKRRKVQRKVPAPFITSRLQQEASRKLRFSPRKTMRVAQSLYEGIELDSGAQGLITYMRTDSTRVSADSVAAARQFIDGKFGADYVPEKPNAFAARKGAQDAHEAIRPTDVFNTPDKVRTFLSPDQLKLYRLIWNRFIACQMKPALFEQLTIEVAAGKHTLVVRGSSMIFAGFTAIYTEGKDDSDGDDDDVSLPRLVEGEKIKFLKVTPSQHFTEPPPRYTDSTLIRELEERGIGRPSTYALILGNLHERDYVRKKKGRLIPSDLGLTVSTLLGESFPDIINEQFTADLESRLDNIASGDADWQKILDAFYKQFQTQLESAKENMRNIKREGVPTDFVCDKCEKPMVLKWGRNGQFLACSAFPECRNTKNVEEDEDGKVRPAEREIETDEKCEKCGEPLVIKHGRYGKFMACSAFPKCRNTRPMNEDRKVGGAEADAKEPLPPCPNCGSPTVRRRGRYGTFVACSAYPKCKTIVRRGRSKQAEEGGE